MAHTHDRTLLNRLGFSDPDKKLKRHDLACRYVAQEDVLRRIFGLSEKTKVYDVEFEHIISKGSGQYMQHVGFADLTAFVRDDERGENSWLLLEVKVTAVSAAEMLRQVKLYLGYLKGYSEAWRTAVVIDFPLDESDKQLLLAEKIRVVRLGKGFEDWLAEQKPDADLEEI